MQVLKNELIDSVSIKTNLESELKTLEDKLSSKRDNLIQNQVAFEKLNNRIESIESEIPIIQEELKNWTNEINKIKNNPALADDLNNWEKGLLEVEDNLKEKNSELENSKTKLKKLEKILQNLEQQYNKLNREKSQLDEKIDEITQKIIDLDLRLENEVFDKLKTSINPETMELLKNTKQAQDENFDLFKFLKLAKSYKIEINASFLELSNNIFFHEGFNTTPDYLIKFIVNYLKNRESEELVEIGAGLNSFSVPLSQEINNLNSLAVVEDEEIRDILKLIYDDCNISWNGELSLKEPNLDVIIYNINFLSNIRSITSDKIKLEDYNEYLNILKFSSFLNETGVGIYLLSADFLLKRSENTVFSNIKKFGLYIDSIMDLPSLEKILIILTKNKPENTFVAELNPNSIEVTFKNFINRKKGIIGHYGSFTDMDSFYSFPSFWAKLESEEVGKETNLKALRFSKIAEEINIKYSKNFGDKPNTIYINDVDVFLSPGGLNEESKIYAQIVLKEDYALSEYLYQFFHTPLGMKIRESFNIPIDDLGIFKSILSQIKVYLPDLNDQIDVVSLNSFILDMETRTNYYRKKLWKSPQDVTDIKNELESIDSHQSEEKFEQWIETLPYPLASILWASITNSNFERKVKYLLHFFEAFSEFNFALMLSGLSADKTFFELEVSRCFKEDSRFRNWYFKPTFGNWYKFGSCLSKTIRRLLEDKNQRNKCLELFGNPDPDFLLRIADKELITIFEEVTNYRNHWEGHGPVVSDLEYENRYKILRSVLSRVYNIISDAYENSTLILPVQSTYKDGIHDYNVKRVMSTRGPFKPDKIETVKLLDAGKIYLVNENQRKPVEILPIIILKEEICYFYNGKNIDKGQARYVSYHYSLEHEISVSMDKFKEVIALLKPKNGHY